MFILWFLPSTAFLTQYCDVTTEWRRLIWGVWETQGAGIVASYPSAVRVRTGLILISAYHIHKWILSVNISVPSRGIHSLSLIARFMGPIWGPSGAGRTQVGPMLAPWTFLFGVRKAFFVNPWWEAISWQFVTDLSLSRSTVHIDIRLGDIKQISNDETLQVAAREIIGVSDLIEYTPENMHYALNNHNSLIKHNTKTIHVKMKVQRGIIYHIYVLMNGVGANAPLVWGMSLLMKTYGCPTRENPN